MSNPGRPTGAATRIGRGLDKYGENDVNGSLRRRAEKDAEAILEGPLCRRNFSINTRDAVADKIEAIIRREIQKERRG